MDTTPSDSSKPRVRDEKNKARVMGNAPSNLSMVSARKAKSIMANGPFSRLCRIAPLRTLYARFGNVEKTARKPGEDQVAHAADDVEREVLARGARRHLAGAHQLHQPNHRNQRGVFQAHLPDVAQARQCVAPDLRDQHPA